MIGNCLHLQILLKVQQYPVIIIDRELIVSFKRTTSIPGIYFTVKLFPPLNTAALYPTQYKENPEKSIAYVTTWVKEMLKSKLLSWYSREKMFLKSSVKESPHLPTRYGSLNWRNIVTKTKLSSQWSTTRNPVELGSNRLSHFLDVILKGRNAKASRKPNKVQLAMHYRVFSSTECNIMDCGNSELITLFFQFYTYSLFCVL